MIEVFTFGDWDIKHNGVSILESKGYQPKLMKLLKYFLTFEGMKITPERIFEELLSDSEYYDPKNVIRTQISRLRYMFEDSTFYDIEYIAGYYVLRLKENCILDFKEFENLINKGNALMDSVQIEAMTLLEQGILLYLGEYLPDLHDADWVVTTRSRYSRLYLRGLYNYLTILNIRQDYEKIIEITEKAIQYKPYEEMIHVYFMESLTQLGQREYALSHYKYFISKMYKDLKINPSDRIRDVYNSIQNQAGEIRGNSYINISTIGDSLQKSCKCSGGKPCNIDYFHSIYNNEFIEGKNVLLKGNHLILITLDLNNTSSIGEEDIKQAMETLLRILSQNLRRDDIFFQCKDGPILILLYDVNYYQLNIIGERIQKRFIQEIGNKEISLGIKSQLV